MGTGSTDLTRQITVTVSLVDLHCRLDDRRRSLWRNPDCPGGRRRVGCRLHPSCARHSGLLHLVRCLCWAGCFYTAWQWLPSQRASSRQRSLGWIVAVSMILNAAWILSVQAGWLSVSVLVILALLVTLVLAFLRYSQSRAASWIEAVVVDGTLGLYLGWTSVAVCANIAAALKASGFSGFGLRPRNLVHCCAGSSRGSRHCLGHQGPRTPRPGSRHRVGPRVDQRWPQRRRTRVVPDGGRRSRGGSIGPRCSDHGPRAEGTGWG
jgi:hypothetical protein